MKRLLKIFICFSIFSILLSVNSYANCDMHPIVIKDKNGRRISSYDNCYYNSSFTESYFNYNNPNNAYKSQDWKKIYDDYTKKNHSKYTNIIYVNTKNTNTIYNTNIINQIINNKNKHVDATAHNEKIEQNILDTNTFSDLSYILDMIDSK